MSDRLLVFGGGGWLGAALLFAAGRRGISVSAPSSTEVDIATPVAVERAFLEARPTFVLNLAAAQPGASQASLAAVNEIGARVVAEAALRHGARLVHVSSDLVLDGRTPPYGDDAPCSPLTPYGRSKAAGEIAVLDVDAGALCVRTSLLWDPHSMDRDTRAFADRLDRGESCRLFTDEIRCPLTRTALAAALLDLAEVPVSGILNIAGREAISRHDYAMTLLAHFDVPTRGRIEPVRAEELERLGAPPRPRNLTLQVVRAELLLDRPLPGIADTLREASEATGPSGVRSHETER